MDKKDGEYFDNTYKFCDFLKDKLFILSELSVQNVRLYYRFQSHVSRKAMLVANTMLKDRDAVLDEAIQGFIRKQNAVFRRNTSPASVERKSHKT